MFLQQECFIDWDVKNEFRLREHSCQLKIFLSGFIFALNITEYFSRISRAFSSEIMSKNTFMDVFYIITILSRRSNFALGPVCFLKECNCLSWGIN